MHTHKRDSACVTLVLIKVIVGFGVKIRDGVSFVKQVLKYR